MFMLRHARLSSLRMCSLSHKHCANFRNKTRINICRFGNFWCLKTQKKTYKSGYNYMYIYLVYPIKTKSTRNIRKHFVFQKFWRISVCPEPNLRWPERKCLARYFHMLNVYGISNGMLKKKIECQWSSYKRDAKLTILCYV